MTAPTAPPPGPPPAAPVLLQAEGAIRRLVLNRPAALNAIDIPFAQAFQAHCVALAADPTVRAVVIEAAGSSFGVGGDLAAFAAAGDAAADVAAGLIDPLHRSALLLSQLNAPVIASVHGHVAGGSFSLALACDVIVAADNARFNLAYAKVGASCDVGASWHLPRRVGLGRALEIALLNPTLDAHAALAIGLVNRVVPAADRAAHTHALAHTLAAGPTQAFGRLKRLLRASADRPLAEQLNDERAGFVASTATHDFRAALGAFFARQPVQFQGW